MSSSSDSSSETSSSGSSSSSEVAQFDAVEYVERLSVALPDILAQLRESHTGEIQEVAQADAQRKMIKNVTKKAAKQLAEKKIGKVAVKDVVAQIEKEMEKMTLEAKAKAAKNARQKERCASSRNSLRLPIRFGRCINPGIRISIALTLIQSKRRIPPFGQSQFCVNDPHLRSTCNKSFPFFYCNISNC
jgi:hypothetical protein